MADIKLTKNELKVQQQKLLQLERYLPTLQLKKSLLQAEVESNKTAQETLKKEYHALEKMLFDTSGLLNLDPAFSLEKCLSIAHQELSSENIAGADLPIFKSLLFHEYTIDLFDSPPWQDSLLKMMREAKIKKNALQIANERITILERELKEVSTRVNLFEKILIPRSRENIKKIKVFLSDMQLSAVSQAKVAKAKILERQMTRVSYAH